MFMMNNKASKPIEIGVMLLFPRLNKYFPTRVTPLRRKQNHSDSKKQFSNLSSSLAS